MSLLFVPLGLWAAIAAPEGKKLRLIGIVVASFCVLPLLWGSYHYFAHGSFVLTANAKW
jgi:hypothetical protein